MCGSETRLPRWANAKYTHGTIRLACHVAHRSRQSRGKKVNAVCAHVSARACTRGTKKREEKRDRGAGGRRERKARQTRPQNTAHSAHFPALSYYSLSENRREWNMKAHARPRSKLRASRLACIWVNPKRRHEDSRRRDFAFETFNPRIFFQTYSTTRVCLLSRQL